MFYTGSLVFPLKCSAFGAAELYASSYLHGLSLVRYYKSINPSDSVLFGALTKLVLNLLVFIIFTNLNDYFSISVQEF